MIEKVCMRLHLSKADAPAKLIELSKAKTLCRIHNQRIRSRKVNAIFNNGRTYKHVVFSLLKGKNALFQFFRFQLPMTDDACGLRNKHAQFFRKRINRFYPIIQHKTLPFSFEDRKS